MCPLVLNDAAIASYNIRAMVGDDSMFCQLETDQKTFEYVKDYLHAWQDDHNIDFAITDMSLQANEIKDHLAHSSIKGQAEVFDWIKKNSAGFRAYLNSVKLAFVAYHCTGNDWRDITWDEFCVIRDRLNEIKNGCLDTLLLEDDIKA